MIAVLVVLVVSAGVIYAGATPAEKCAVGKMKATGKKFDARLKCYEKAVSKGIPVDGNCLSAADTKFNAAAGKAETKGGCSLTGDGPTLGTSVENDANAVVALTTASPKTCCSLFGGFACYYTAGDPNCLADLGTPGAAGTVCDGSGACTAPPAHPGPTCSATFTAPPFSAPGVRCLAGPFLTSLNPPRTNELTQCQNVVNVDGDPNAPTKYDPNGICPPDGGPAVE